MFMLVLEQVIDVSKSTRQHWRAITALERPSHLARKDEQDIPTVISSRCPGNLLSISTAPPFIIFSSYTRSPDVLSLPVSSFISN